MSQMRAVSTFQHIKTSIVGMKYHRPAYQIKLLRTFHTTPSSRTDGVYPALTEMRVKTPWIEALRKQRERGLNPTQKPEAPGALTDRDLRPRKMSESYHRVACSPIVEQSVFH